MGSEEGMEKEAEEIEITKRDIKGPGLKTLTNPVAQNVLFKERSILQVLTSVTSSNREPSSRPRRPLTTHRRPLVALSSALLIVAPRASVAGPVAAPRRPSPPLATLALYLAAQQFRLLAGPSHPVPSPPASSIRVCSTAICPSVAVIVLRPPAHLRVVRLGGAGIGSALQANRRRCPPWGWRWLPLVPSPASGLTEWIARNRIDWSEWNGWVRMGRLGVTGVYSSERTCLGDVIISIAISEGFRSRSRLGLALPFPPSSPYPPIHRCRLCHSRCWPFSSPPPSPSLSSLPTSPSPPPPPDPKFSPLVALGVPTALSNVTPAALVVACAVLAVCCERRWRRRRRRRPPPRPTSRWNSIRFGHKKAPPGCPPSPGGPEAVDAPAIAPPRRAAPRRTAPPHAVGDGKGAGAASGGSARDSICGNGKKTGGDDSGDCVVSGSSEVVETESIAYLTLLTCQSGTKRLLLAVHPPRIADASTETVVPPRRPFGDWESVAMGHGGSAAHPGGVTAPFPPHDAAPRRAAQASAARRKQQPRGDPNAARCRDAPLPQGGAGAGMAHPR
ncbi:Protein of unknown function [Gryllus bimaculatus]|nr:Protein of unknown function [Gryllus bimaculatus]